jgi:probable lipoprotein NlpC
MKGPGITLAFLCLALASYAAAEAPVSAAQPKKARGRIVDTALSYAGAPYAYGGIDASGFDCSGLVYRVFLQTLGIVLPRTAREQYAFREPIDASKVQPGDLLFFDTTGPLSHVGIYEGEGRFVHAASDGPRRGVIESSLSEAYWAKTFTGAGRIIPPAEYLGLIFSSSLGPSFGTEDFLRGARGSLGIAYKIFGIETGVELRPEYDATLGDFRLPAVLALGIDRRLKVFAGPALTFGTPKLSGSREYEAGGGILATAGIEFTPFTFRVGSMKLGLTGELVYNRYVALASADLAQDAAARIRAGVALSARWGI